MLGIGCKWNKCINSFIPHVSQHVLIVVIATTIILQIRNGVEELTQDHIKVCEPSWKIQVIQLCSVTSPPSQKLLSECQQMRYSSAEPLMTKSVKYNKNLKPCFQPFQNLRDLKWCLDTIYVYIWIQ